MKNSQYSNQANVSINELVRIKFNEVSNFGDGEQTHEIITISLAMEDAKVLVEALTNTINAHEQILKNQKENNKELN